MHSLFIEDKNLNKGLGLKPEGEMLTQGHPWWRLAATLLRNRGLRWEWFVL